MSDLDKDMKGGRVRRVGCPEEPDDGARIIDVYCALSGYSGRGQFPTFPAGGGAAVSPRGGGGGQPGGPGPFFEGHRQSSAQAGEELKNRRCFRLEDGFHD
jgi:hypothetical protein